MFKTLHGKLSAALLALLCVVGLLYVSLTLRTTRSYLNEVNQTLNRALASDLAKHLIGKNLLRPDAATRDRTKAEISQSMVLNPDIEIYILDPRGVILDYSAAPGAVQTQRVSLRPIRDFLAKPGALPILGDDPRHPGRRKIFSASPIPPGGEASPNRLKGYIYIILGGDQYDAVAQVPGRSYVVRLSAWAMAGSLSLVALAGVLLFGFLTRRLRRLMNGVEKFQAEFALQPAAAREYSQAAKNRGDEISHLESAFSQMAARIRAHVASRALAEQERREAISNVSHDLRTPLAALQGYLETLLMKENQLSADEQRAYLQTAIRHSERLGKLVASLFELAQLDSRDMEPNLEEFSLAELMQDAVQQRQLVAQEKGVRLETRFSTGTPSFVRADIGLIERALENLIENALRHTPRGGLVTVGLEVQGECVAVKVADNGTGIAAEDLPHVFDRSYRAAPTIAEESAVEESPAETTSIETHAGLGLAITKRIVELHGGEIEAQSAPGEGATFTFTLPLNAASTRAAAL